MTTVGSGPDVVLVPGLAVSRYLRSTQELLAERARVHLLEPPGTGRAPDPPDVGLARSPGLVEDAAVVAEWLTANLARPAVLVGHSYGTQVVARAALVAPEKVRALVLASPTIDPAYRTWPRLFARWMRDSHREPAGLARFQRSEQRRAGPRRILGMVRTMLADDPEEWLDAVHVPLTVVRGTRDALSTPEWARRLADRPGGRLVEVPDAPHAFPYDRPEALAEVVAGVLERDHR